MKKELKLNMTEQDSYTVWGPHIHFPIVTITVITRVWFVREIGDSGLYISTSANFVFILIPGGDKIKYNVHV